jgi:hypothetical protein
VQAGCVLIYHADRIATKMILNGAAYLNSLNFCSNKRRTVNAVVKSNPAEITENSIWFMSYEWLAESQGERVVERLASTLRVQ